jgi:cyclic pyranopterin phosphate synthase
LENVILGIKEAINYNIKIKINTVVMKNFNENELEELIIWCNNLKIDITFIEVMPMEETDISRHMQFAPLDKVYDNLNKKFNFKKTNLNTGGPAVYYSSEKLSNKIGFITPLTNNFCESCNRIRITSTGKLFMCLGQNDHVDFREILRGDFTNDYIKNKISYALNIKPREHNFLIEENSKPYMQRHMNVTGG